MAQFVGGAYIGATAVREDFYLNAKHANEPKDNIRGQDTDEAVAQKTSWFKKRPKVNLRIRETCTRRGQFRWKKIKPDYS
jgi:hypothetical protein